MEDVAHRHQPDFLISQRGGTRSLFSTFSSSNNSGSNDSISNNTINNHNTNINNNCMRDRRSLPPTPSSALPHPLSIDPVKPPQTTSKISSTKTTALGGCGEKEEVIHNELLGSMSVLPFCSDDGFCISITPEIVNAIPRGRVPCHMGCSMRDWSHLLQQRQHKTKVEFKQGVITMAGKSLPRLSMTEVMRHTSADDLWLVIRGVVYDCTRFKHFHPGGGRLLLQCAGRDCTALYDYYHRWVSCDGLLAPFAVGVIETSHQQRQKN
ncbi:Cytochrome b5-like heme/steroid binding domain [Trypanosoma melophagium]|uniref:Cytochrome b5-like heme/steroid binding domain n=1 Tax=Trypanosoma melophagium TaxID=715481 RepID=UPI00351A309A|nr:Cytochrome b5-like heme/steroid binding domain [Trypanosoma melophagium]